MKILGGVKNEETMLNSQLPKLLKKHVKSESEVRFDFSKVEVEPLFKEDG